MCYGGEPHNLKEIYRNDVGWNEEHVVQWCEDCGSVMVELESDNRIFGTVVRMKFPKNMIGGGKDVKRKRQIKTG